MQDAGYGLRQFLTVHLHEIPEDPADWGYWGAAGEGFEPSLTDPELISLRSLLFADVSKTAHISRILIPFISGRSLLFAPATVKSLSDRCLG